MTTPPKRRRPPPRTTPTTESTAITETTTSTTTATGAAENEEIDPNTFSTDRPESPVGGVVFDAVTFLTFPPQMGVCTWETLLVSMTEEEFLAADSATREESVITAARDCQLDEEVLPSLRLTLQKQSELFAGETG